MPYRFYVPDLVEAGVIKLDGVEAHHLIHVLRGKPGEQVELFNGAGLCATAEVVAVHKRDTDLRILQAHQDATTGPQIILGTAVPKGDRIDWLIEKATELGVTKIVPLVTERSVVDPRDSKLEKLRQTVIAACKQSGAIRYWNSLRSLRGPVSVRPNSRIGSPLSLIPNPGAPRFSSALLDNHSAVVFAIGPEGGLTDAEAAYAEKSGARMVSLGPVILRIETAALALAACAAAR